MTDRVVGRRIVRLVTVGSTMDEVARLAAAGEAEGTVVVAESQTAGRGRAGRAWHAPPGTALLCSVLLRPPVPPARLSTLPLIVGVAVAEAIEAVVGTPCRLKWPNDVWLGGGVTGCKVAGILLASRLAGAAIDHVVVGVGVNVAVPVSDLPPGATSMSLEAGCALGVEELLKPFLVRLDIGYRVYLAAAGAPSLAPWRWRVALLDEPVVVEIAGERREGILRGVDDGGALLLEDVDGSVVRVVAGELVRGPARLARA